MTTCDLQMQGEIEFSRDFLERSKGEDVHVSGLISIAFLEVDT